MYLLVPVRNKTKITIEKILSELKKHERIKDL